MSNSPNEMKFADAWQIGYERGYDDSTATGQIEPDPEFSPDIIHYYWEGYQQGADAYYKDHDFDWHGVEEDYCDSGQDVDF